MQVDVNYNEEMRRKVRDGVYRLPPNDRELDPMENISNVWSEPPPDDHLHVYVTVTGGGKCIHTSLCYI